MVLGSTPPITVLPWTIGEISRKPLWRLCPQPKTVALSGRRRVRPGSVARSDKVAIPQPLAGGGVKGLGLEQADELINGGQDALPHEGLRAAVVLMAAVQGQGRVEKVCRDRA